MANGVSQGRQLTAIDNAIERPMTVRAWEKGVALVLRAVQTVWAPLSVAVFGILLILFVVTAMLIQQRLQVLAELSTVSPTAAAVPPAQVLGTGDFTLAPEDLRNLSEDDARVFNAGIPFSTLPILAAKPFIMAPDNIEAYSRALDCLTTAIYYEAASETPEGQAAVAQVVLNRMHHPAYPATVCGVVFQGSERTTGCQFSFTCDGAMGRTPSVEGWARAKAVAAAALNGSVAAGVGMATHYHTDWVAPYWAPRLVKMRQIGTHIFYRWAGGWGLPFAFNKQHAGTEPVIAKMAALSTPLEIMPELVLEEDLAPPPLIVAALPPAPPMAVTFVPVEPQAAASEPVAAAPAPVMNPLTSQGETRPRRRSRIATPSGW